jgi:hypothetical protein
MRFPLYVLGFGFVLSVAVVSAQTAQQPQTPVNPTTPASQVGDGAQSKSGTPVQPTSTAPSTTAPSTTGGVAGSASSSTAQSPDVQTSETGGVSAMTDSDLQGQIQGALSKEPTLTGDNPHVSVSGDTIELAGAVNTNKEKITASRIVQSYAGSKKLVNNLTISGKSDKTPVTAPANNPEPEKGGSPTTPKPPQK